MSNVRPNIVNLYTVNAEKWIEEPGNVYIGRRKDNLIGSKWGNPHVITNTCSRTRAVELYKKHILKKETLRNSIHELKDKLWGVGVLP